MGKLPNYTIFPCKTYLQFTSVSYLINDKKTKIPIFPASSLTNKVGQGFCRMIWQIVRAIYQIALQFIHRKVIVALLDWRRCSRNATLGNDLTCFGKPQKVFKKDTVNSGGLLE